MKEVMSRCFPYFQIYLEFWGKVIKSIFIMHLSWSTSGSSSCQYISLMTWYLLLAHTETVNKPSVQSTHFLFCFFLSFLFCFDFSIVRMKQHNKTQKKYICAMYRLYSICAFQRRNTNAIRGHRMRGFKLFLRENELSRICQSSSHSLI